MTVGYFLDVKLDKQSTTQWDFLSNIDSKVILGAMANNINTSGSLYKYRDQYTKLGYIIGQNSGIKDGNKYYGDLWTNYLSKLVSKIKDEKSLASSIWNSNAFASQQNALKPSEKTPTPKNGGYVFWAQDLEFDVNKDLENQFKGMITLLWAGRKVLGDDFKIIPVISNSIQRNWNDATKKEYVDISSLIDSDLKNLGLQNLTPRTDGRSWNLMSYLKENKLIDGFIGESYKPENIGQLDPNTAPFEPSQNLAYAVMGNWTMNLENATKPIKSDFYGTLPLNASAYFYPDKAPAEQFKSSSFDPVPKNLIAYNASKHQIQNNTQIVDLTDLSVGKTAQVQVNLSRDANFTVQAGFYSVANHQGAVKDPVTGQLVQPSNSNYAEIAMSSENSISQLKDLSLVENGFVDLPTVYNLGSDLMAPYVRVLEPGAERTYFSFALANPDKINHFKQISSNSFGIEDTLGGGDNDFNDLILSLKFLDVT